MALKQTDSYVIHHYPDYIMGDDFENRKIEIRVIANETLNGVGEEFKKKMEKKVNDVKEIYTDNFDLWEKATQTPVDINTSQIVEKTKRIQNGSLIYSAVLPLPNTFTDRGSHVWDDATGLVSETAKSSVESLLGNVSKKIVGETDGKDQKSFLNSFKKSITGLASDMVKKSSSGFDELASSLGFRQASIDPGYWQQYSKTLPRQFDFEFDLIPNNAGEARMIQNIILNLKKFSTPTSTVSGVSLLSPYTFEILFGNKKIQRLVNMSNVVCRNIDVNYSGDGNMLMFSNGMPTYIKLTLGFAEANVVTAEYYT